MDNIICKGKTKGENSWWIHGNFIKERSTGRCFIADLSHFDSETKLNDIMVEVIPETVEQVIGE